jgi:hypothetical protein
LGFKAVSGLMHSALVEYEFELQHGNDFRQWDARTKFSKESDNLLDLLGRAAKALGLADAAIIILM